MVSNSHTSRIPGRAVKIGRGPITAGLLTLAVLGTYFGVNLISTEDFVGQCAQDRCQSVVAAESVTETGATTNTLWLDQPFGSGAAIRGYETGSGVNLSLVLDVVANPTNANFDCYWGREDTGTGAGISVIQNLSATGTIVVQMSGAVVGPDMGLGCNTTSRIKSNTRIEAVGVFLNSAVEN